MIRQALTTLFCAALFFLMVFVIPAQAQHPASAPYFCTTVEAAKETSRLQIAGQMDELREKAMSDSDFKCWFNESSVPFVPIDLVYAYEVEGVARGFIAAYAPDKTIVYLFGTMDFINWLLHERGA